MDTLAKEKLRRHGLFDARVPRFTSYPPANRFSGEVSGAEAAQWRGAAPDGSELSLYVHIPFCRRLCWFCACRTQGTKTDAPLARYIDSVLAEASAVRRDLPPTVNVRRLHLGGGTPTILPVPLMQRLLAGLDTHFGIGGLDEFAAEIDPTEVDEARLACLVDHGLNRASLGVQDFDPRVQQAIGRWQSVEATANVAGMLRRLGVDALNVDLLYGLPFQTEDSLHRTLDAVAELAPSRIALYGYAHVPWMSKRQAVVPADALPGTETRYDLFESARHRLLAEGYVQIGIDHFARPSDSLAVAFAERRLARSFQGYTDDRIPRLVGLGASAISHYPEGYVQNQPATALYQSVVEKGASAVARGIGLGPSERARAELIETLMCYGEIRLADLRHAVPEVETWLRSLVARYPDALYFRDGQFGLYSWAMPLVRIVAAQLGRETDHDNGYSSAI